MLKIASCLVLLLCVVSSPAQDPAAAKTVAKFDAIDRYAEQQIRGWRVLVHRDLLAEELTSLRKRTATLLTTQLRQIEETVPEAAVNQLRKIPIWVEVAHPKHPCMCYHPDAGWLRDNGMNPAKARAVEIANCENFLGWTKDQPWMVLHELAHGYHHQVLKNGFENSEVLEAFQQARKSQRYDSVLRINGRKEKAYAMNNQQEYFAEQTEAFFGKNDFFPFDRAELREHDPKMHDLLRKLWDVK